MSSATFAAAKSFRQETVLLEAAARVRRYAGLGQNAKHTRPLIVVVTKYDAWCTLLRDRSMNDPWVERGGVTAFDRERVEKRSSELRELLLRVCPEIVTAAEGFAQEVVYVPVSALGRAPDRDPKSGTLAMRPRQIMPLWATVPLLYGLCRWLPGLIPTLKRKPGAGVAVANDGQPAAVSAAKARRRE